MASAAQIPEEQVAETAVRQAPAPPRRLRIASFPSILETNPYQRLLYGELGKLGYELAADAEFTVAWLARERGRTGLLHFHWPQPFWRHGTGPVGLRRPLSYLKLGLFAARLVVARALRYRVVWTVHQVYPHEVESERLDRLGAIVLARFSSILIAHDGGTLEAARRELGRSARKVEVVPHGSYIGVYPPGQGRTVARANLGIPEGAFALLCFGDLRAYKEVERLLAAFSATELPGAALVVAGTVCASEHGQAVHSRAAADPRIKPLLGFVPDERVSDLFAAADAAVIARGDGGTSGSLILALSMGVPVVAARTDVYRELLGDGAAGWLFQAGDTDSLRATLEEAAATGVDGRRRKGDAARKQAERLSWPEIGRRTAALLAGERA